MANLPADLPENWTLGQIVSPNGTETGLTPQHGYNYLMAQVNAAQTAINNIVESLGEVAQETSVQDIISLIGTTTDSGASLTTGSVFAKENQILSSIYANENILLNLNTDYGTDPNVSEQQGVIYQDSDLNTTVFELVFSPGAKKVKQLFMSIGYSEATAFITNLIVVIDGTEYNANASGNFSGLGSLVLCTTVGSWSFLDSPSTSNIIGTFICNDSLSIKFKVKSATNMDGKKIFSSIVYTENE